MIFVLNHDCGIQEKTKQDVMIRNFITVPVLSEKKHAAGEQSLANEEKTTES